MFARLGYRNHIRRVRLYFLPVFRLLYRKQLIVNIDGLEHRRAKWGKFARWFLRTSESDGRTLCWRKLYRHNKGIQDYVGIRIIRKPELVAYGGGHAQRNVTVERQNEILGQYGIAPGNYAVSVCRIEPENNCHLILKAFATSGKNLVFVGNWERSEYSRRHKEEYCGRKNIQMVDSVYDLDILYALRNQCRCYIHGHSAGGTNPSLMEAMFFGKPILAYDVI